MGPMVMATTERDQLMPRPRLSQRLGTMAATAMDGLHMATATTERGPLMPRPRLSPTTTATPPMVMATTERGLLMPRPRLSQRLGTMEATATDGLHMATATTERGLLRPRLSPTTMATPPTAMVATMERGP